VAVDPTGQFAYVANEGSYNVWAYSIDGTTGALTPVAGSPFPAGVAPNSVTVDPTGQFAYVTNGGGSNKVSAFTIDGLTGELAPVDGSPFPAGTFPVSVTTTAGPPPAAP
jgi:DNA-binding beta-propeller fold protein YncE